MILVYLKREKRKGPTQKRNCSGWRLLVNDRAKGHGRHYPRGCGGGINYKQEHWPRCVGTCILSLNVYNVSFHHIFVLLFFFFPSRNQIKFLISDEIIISNLRIPEFRISNKNSTIPQNY